jgi:hypothetical protein
MEIMRWLSAAFGRALTAVERVNLSDEEFSAYLASLGVRVELRADSSFRCACCNQMKQVPTTLAWIPDGIRASDPMWHVVERINRERWNSHSSGWCLLCCRRLKPSAPDELLKANEASPGADANIPDATPMTTIFDESHHWPEGTFVGFDRGVGNDRAVHVRFTRTAKAWRMWLDEDGFHWWTPAKARRDCKRFIREEIARRRMERRSR